MKSSTKNLQTENLTLQAIWGGPVRNGSGRSPGPWSPETPIICIANNEYPLQEYSWCLKTRDLKWKDNLVSAQYQGVCTVQYNSPAAAHCLEKPAPVDFVVHIEGFSPVRSLVTANGVIFILPWSGWLFQKMLKPWLMVGQVMAWTCS